MRLLVVLAALSLTVTLAQVVDEDFSRIAETHLPIADCREELTEDVASMTTTLKHHQVRLEELKTEKEHLQAEEQKLRGAFDTAAEEEQLLDKTIEAVNHRIQDVRARTVGARNAADASLKVKNLVTENLLNLAKDTSRIQKLQAEVTQTNNDARLDALAALEEEEEQLEAELAELESVKLNPLREEVAELQQRTETAFKDLDANVKRSA